VFINRSSASVVLPFVNPLRTESDGYVDTLPQTALGFDSPRLNDGTRRY
jgi:hypothetical protein